MAALLLDQRQKFAGERGGLGRVVVVDGAHGPASTLMTRRATAGSSTPPCARRIARRRFGRNGGKCHAAHPQSGLTPLNSRVTAN